MLCDIGFFGCDGLRKFALDDAVDLQNHQRMGKPRRFHAFVGVDTVAFRRARRQFRRELAFCAESACARGAIVDRLRLLFIYSVYIQSFRAAVTCTIRRARTLLVSSRYSSVY